MISVQTLDFIFFTLEKKKLKYGRASAMKSHTNNSYPQIKLKNIIQNISCNTVK